jgi:APA family basic amino acid/polyamine antiporter
MKTPRLFNSGGLFRTKPADAIVSEMEHADTTLKRALGPVQLTLIGIGAIIGAGIFATIGTAAAGDAQRPGAGPALVVSFVITAIVCSFTALCYAEFASMIPVSGSAYTYSYASLGEVIAWIIGWDLTIEYAVGNIGVAVSWANYFNDFLEAIPLPWKDKTLRVPDWLSLDYQSAAAKGALDTAPHLFGYPIVFNLLAVSIVTAITVVLVWGIRESARFNAVMVAIKILVLTFFIVVGTMWLDPDNWKPFMPPKGWAGVSAGAAIVFFAYIGFDAVSTVAEETRNPQRNMPIGIIASLVICTVFYVIVSAVFTGLIPLPVLEAKSKEQAEPLTLALKYARPDADWAVGIVAFGSVIAHTAVLLVFQLGQPRIFMAMSRDGLLPPVFSRIHWRFRTPYVGTILTGVFVALFSSVANISDMVDLTNIGTLFAFILVCAGIIVLKVKEPNRERKFRVPSGWTWTIGLYAIFACGVLLVSLPIGENAGGLDSATKGNVAVILAVSAVIFALCRNHIFPVLGVVSCLYLIYYLPPTSWLRFAAWLNIGFLIYVGYGSVHSHLTGRQLSARPAEHDAHTARNGIVLGFLGSALVVAMRAFDLWLQGLKTHEHESGMERAWAAFKDIGDPAGWLPQTQGGILSLLQTELFWFLLLPLALNALVLCPIVVRRAYRARMHGAWVSMTAAVAMAATILVYFVTIAKHSLGQT